MKMYPDRQQSFHLRIQGNLTLSLDSSVKLFPHEVTKQVYFSHDDSLGTLHNLPKQ